MKSKVLFFLLAGCLLALAAWLVRVPTPAQADEIPEKYRETVHKGLEFLVKSQHKDGHWEGDGGKHPVAMTGLAGIALLMERNPPSGRGIGGGERGQPKYSADIRKAVDWLMDQSQPKRDGLIFSGHASETARYMQGHGLATLFLAGAFEARGIDADDKDRARREKLTDILTRAVKYIVKAQSSQGGWYHTSKVEGHDFDEISATAIQIQALQAAENAGIPVPAAAINDGQEYLKKALEKFEQRAKAEQNANRAVDPAAALACRFTQSIQGGREDELRKKWLKYCQGEIPVGRKIKFGQDELTHYYYAQAVFNFGGKTWDTYRTATFDHLKSSQNKDGSWPAGDGISVGPVYSTALSCIILQLDKRSHPSMPPPRPTVTF
jgi:hypothetical protein